MLYRHAYSVTLTGSGPTTPRFVRISTNIHRISINRAPLKSGDSQLFNGEGLVSIRPISAEIWRRESRAFGRAFAGDGVLLVGTDGRKIGRGRVRWGGYEGRNGDPDSRQEDDQQKEAHRVAAILLRASDMSVVSPSSTDGCADHQHNNRIRL